MGSRYYTNPKRIQKIQKKLDRLRDKDRTADEERELEQLVSKLAVREGYLLANITDDSVFGLGMLAELKRSLTEEFEVTTQSEHMILDILIASYHRSIKLEKMANTYMKSEDGNYSMTELRVKIINVLHKGIERSDRQFLEAYGFLNSLKRPIPKIKVVAQNAIVGQNQEFNSK